MDGWLVTGRVQSGRVMSGGGISRGDRQRGVAGAEEGGGLDGFESWEY